MDHRVRGYKAIGGTLARVALVALGGLVTLVGGGCGGDDATAFPPGLEPLMVDPVTPPAAQGPEMYPEAFTAIRGETDAFVWVHGAAYVHAPLRQVMAALLDPVVAVDRRQVQEWSVTQNDEPTYPYSYLLHNTSHSIITVTFDLAWRLGVRDGTADAPLTFEARYQKTYGTTFITLLAGSIVARAINDNVTLLDMVRELKAAGSGADDVEQYLRDLTASVTARVHGQPLPNYN